MSNVSQIKSSNFEKWVKENTVAKLLFFLIMFPSTACSLHTFKYLFELKMPK